MLDLVELYTERGPGNVLAPYLPALRRFDGSDSRGASTPACRTTGAGPPTRTRSCAGQDDERDGVYFDPAVRRGKEDGLRTLGQFAYYDAMVMHGDGGDLGFGSIRERALGRARGPGRRRGRLCAPSSTSGCGP
ncbi:chitosanase CsnA [Streptomyces violaceorubidus]